MAKEQKRSASERIRNLEETLVGTLKALGALDNEQQVIKEAIRLLGNKMDAMVKLIAAGQPLTETNIANVMVQNKADKMAENTQQMVTQGVLVKSDTVDANSFIVGREIEDNGNVINPRIQFTVESAQDHLKAKVLGAKVLDRILVEEGKAQLEVLEIYSINEPKAPEASPAPAAAAPDAPAAEETAPQADSAPAQA